MAKVTEPIELDRSFVRDAYRAYEQLGIDAPPRAVLLPDGVPGWLVTRYADARQLLDDRRLSKDHAGFAELFPEGTAGVRTSPLTNHMLSADPPNHTRLRKLIAKAFTGRAIARLRPRVEELTAGLLSCLSDGVVDLIDEFAFPLPVAVISELLGVPEEDRESFRFWAKAFTGTVPPADAERARGEADAYLRGLIDGKRATPTPDLLSDLVRVTDEGDRLTEDELVAMSFLLLVAGHETTVNLIGNGVLALVRHPDQMAALRADLSLLPGAIEEFLRYDGPVHIATTRYTVEEVEIGGVVIPPNEFVLVSLLAANRDEKKFTDPESFDITRPTAGHLGFGFGIHHCIGAPLARLEAEIAIGSLLNRFKNIELAAEPTELEWRGSQLIHGLNKLPLKLS